MVYHIKVQPVKEKFRGPPVEGYSRDNSAHNEVSEE